MTSCTIDIVKARERVPTSFAAMSCIRRQQRSIAPSANDGIMMSEKAIAKTHPCTEQNAFHIDSSPLRGAVHTLPPITVQVASQSNWETL